jgi:hypothetical protein
VIDVGAILTPGGKYVDERDGKRLRDDDGVHISNDGARLVGATIIPELLRIAQRPPAGVAASPAAGPGPG